MQETTKLPVLCVNRQYRNNTHLTQSIFSGYRQITDELTTVKAVIKKQSVTSAELWTDPSISTSQELAPFDKEVLDAIYTIYHETKQNCFTLDWVARVLTGSSRPSANLKSTIEASINRLRNIDISIDFTDELKHYKRLRDIGIKTVLEGKILEIRRIMVIHEKNGKTSEGFILLALPSLYEYAESLKHIVSYPAEWFVSPPEIERCNSTIDYICLQRYVLLRVAQMRGKNHMCSNKVSFRWTNKAGEECGLLKSLGISPESDPYWRTKTKPTLVKGIRSTLTTLKSHGFIKDFHEYRSGNSSEKNASVEGFLVEFDAVTKDDNHVKSGDAPRKK